MTTTQVENATSSVYTQNTDGMAESNKTAKIGNYGKTIGEPKLSEEASKYYEELKNKYGDMDFILVSKDMKEMAKSMAGSYANPNKMVVLIDEEKLEKMATDEEYRKKYEGIIANAKNGIGQLQQSIGSNTKVKGYGMLFQDGGNASFFAVIDKSLEAQRRRIRQKAADKKEHQKAEEKKELRREQEEKLRERVSKDSWGDSGIQTDENSVVITASSIEELERKIEDYLYEDRSNHVWTEQEKMIGQNMDFRL